ncbi:hypothetical protein [Shewanella goraebulensis]|uniref:hypothetical protein n=1 Tax=Shewanella goraebulensis TaxID=3050637 RepID=UPI00254EB79C|nr:hypothetical protein [Shewanella goraebulensis]
MKRSMKFRLGFLALAIISYVIGFQVLPEQLNSAYEMTIVGGMSALYFLVLPILYWIAIINIGQQKTWKILMILSLSALMARLSFPPEIASYFEFMMWIKYPVIVIIILLEMYLLISVVKGLWHARKLKGDPRIKALNMNKDEKSQMVGMIMAGEAANWFYSIPKFSANHPKAIANIRLISANMWFMWLMISLCFLGSTIAYLLLVDWSEIAAVLVSAIVGYGFLSFIANYRLSRHYSLYMHDEKLVVNNSMWGLLMVDINDIKSVTIAETAKSTAEEILFVGRGDTANVIVDFKQTQRYFGAMGQMPEPIEQLLLVLDKPQLLKLVIEDCQQQAEA